MFSFEKPAASVNNASNEGLQNQEDMVGDVERLNPIEAAQQEKGFFSSLTGKARGVAQVMMFVTASAAFAYPGEAEARKKAVWAGVDPVTTSETTPNNATEVANENTVPKLEKDPKTESKEERLTSAGKIFQKIAEQAQADLERIQNPRDAEMFARLHFDYFVNEYFDPSVGSVQRYRYHRDHREYSLGDLREIQRGAELLVSLLAELHDKYQIKSYDQRTRSMSNLIKELTSKIAWESTYAGSAEIRKQYMKQEEGRWKKQRQESPIKHRSIRKTVYIRNK